MNGVMIVKKFNFIAKKFNFIAKKFDSIVNKFDFILKLTYISYILIIKARPYVTARTWADIVMFIFVNSIIYQLCYLFFLRKKENVSFLRSLAKMFLYFSFVINAYIIFYYIDIYINGYTFCFLSFVGETHYGFEAWKEYPFGIPVIIVFTIYEICYFVALRRTKKPADKSS